MKNFDIVIIGGGIVGVSTAWQLIKQYQNANILLVEKEKRTCPAPDKQQPRCYSCRGILRAG